MTYPVDVPAFVAAYLSNLDNPDDVDFQVAEAMANVINKAYYAGLTDGQFES